MTTEPKTCRRTPALDLIGGCVSLLCAVHCLLLPILLPVAAGFVHNLWGEILLVAAAIGVGALALSHGYKRHGFRLPTVLFASGMTLIVLGNWVLTGGKPLSASDPAEHEGSLFSILLVALGGLLVVAAHAFNFYLERGKSIRKSAYTGK